MTLDSVSVAPQVSSPPHIPEQATAVLKQDNPEKKEAASSEHGSLANAPVEPTNKDTDTSRNPEASSDTTTGELNASRHPSPPDLGRSRKSSVPASVAFEQDSSRILSGPGPTVIDSPPDNRLPTHDIANCMESILQTGNGGSPASQSQVFSPQEPAQMSSSSSVFHEQLSNGFAPSVTTSTPNRPTSVPRQFNTLVPLLDHLISIAGTKEGADWATQVNPPTGQSFVTYGHSIILTRSLRLRKLMDRQKTTTYAANLVNLFPARQVVPHAFEAALRFLYSDTVLSDNFFTAVPPGPDHHAARLHNLDYILSYWVAGIELGLEPVSACAERILAGYLKWDIIEVTYKHALELGNSPLSAIGKNMTGTDYLVASNSIIRIILQFLANNMDIDKFVLDVNNPSTLFPPRLPQLDDGRPKFNPALATMVFGSMPSTAAISPSLHQSEPVVTATPTPTPTFPDTVASNILLNVDFESLNFFNELLRARNKPASSQVMAAVVAEREARRLKILNTQSISNRDRMANSASWEPVGLKESLNGTSLERERVGFLLSSKPEP